MATTKQPGRASLSSSPPAGHPLVGIECTRCLGTGTPEHFSLHQPDGLATCPNCHGTGRIRLRITPACPCECNRGGFCGGCGHAGCGRRCAP